MWTQDERLTNPRTIGESKQRKRSKRRRSGGRVRRRPTRFETLEKRNLLACDANICVEVKFVDPDAPTVEVSSLLVNQDYEAQVFIQDNRPNSPSGIFQAYFDVAYDAGLIDVAANSIQHGSQFPIRNLGDSSASGIINAAGGGSAGLPNPRDGSFLLFSFPFDTVATGTLNLGITQDASSSNRVEYFIPSGPVSTNDIDFDGTSIVVMTPAAPTLSIESTSDANESGANGVFTVRQSMSTATATVVAYSVAGSATSSSDFVGLSGTVTIPAGSTSATIVVQPVNDTIVEPTENVLLTLSSISSGDASVVIGSSNAATVDLIDNDSANVQIAATRDGNEAGSLAGQFTLTQTAVSSTATTITYSVVGGTATAGADTGTLAGTVTIPAGQTTAVIDIPVVDDAVIEGTETFTLRLDSISSGNASVTLGATIQATLNISDNDTALVSVSVATNGAEAGSVAANFTVNQSAVSNVDTVVRYSISGSAIAGNDFTAPSGVVTIPAGATSASVSVPIADDNLVEELETIVLTLDSIDPGSPGVTISSGVDRSAAANLADNDTAVISVAAVSDGSETGPTSGQFRATQSAVSSTDTVITYSLSGSASSGIDYVTPSGSVTIPAGSTTATVSLAIIDDALTEGSETVTLVLGSITAGDDDISIDTNNSSATLQITDNETPLVRIDATASANEANAGLPARLTVSQSITTNTDTQVNYQVSGTATSGTDFVALSGVATIPAGQLSAVIDATVIDDSLIEGTETLVVTITSISGDASLVVDDVNDDATVEIADNDTAVIGVTALRDASETGPLSGQFTIGQSRPSTIDTVVAYQLSGTATESNDFIASSGTVTIPAGQTSVTVDVPVIDDELVEPTETIVLTLTSVVSGAVDQISIDSAQDNATVSLADNDLATVSIAVDADGDESGPSDGQFSVTLSRVSSTDTSIDYTVSGTATPGFDYASLSGSVVIPAGELSTTILVGVIDDDQSEGSETVIVTLDSVASGNSGVTLNATNSASVQIVDDELPQVSISTANDANESGAVAGAFTLTQSIATNVDTTVSYSISGTAQSGQDFTALGGTAVIPSNSTSTTISVPVLDDLLVEGIETVTLTITNIAGDPLVAIDAAHDNATLNIVDDDTATVTIFADSDAAEAGVSNGQFTVSLSQSSVSDTVVSLLITGNADSDDDFNTLPTEVTIPAGEVSVPIAVVPIDDAKVEPDETVVITLQSISSGVTDQISIDTINNSAQVLIVDNDTGTVDVTAENNGSETGPTSGQILVTQSVCSATDTVVTYTVTGTATPGDDYIALSGSVTIPTGEVSAVITVVVIDDELAEGAESVIVTLDELSVGDRDISIGGSNQSTIQISDDDVPRVGIAATTDASEAGLVGGVFTLTQTIVTSTPTTVRYSVGGTASSGDDFTALTGIVTIAAGELTATIDVPVLDDALIEGDETIVVSITELIGDDQLELDVAASAATIRLNDNETGLISIVGDMDGNETAATVGAFVVTQDGVAEVDTVIAYSVGGTATTGDDYEVLSGTVTIPAGQTSTTITTTVVDDDLVEPTESLQISLDQIISGNTALSLDPSAQSDSIAILDNDAATVSLIAVNDANEDGSQSGLFTITQSSVSSIDTVIAYDVSGEATLGDDFASLSGTVTIPAGLTSASIVIDAVSDDIVESNETVRITLSQVDAGNDAISIDSANETAQIAIQDDDSAVVGIAAVQNTSEGSSVAGSLLVSQSAVSSSDTIVAITVLGTATAGDDFVAIAQTVIIPAGQTSAFIFVDAIDDGLLESDESLTVNLDSISASNAQITIDANQRSASVTITDNESGTVVITPETNANESGLVNGVFSVSQDGVTTSDTVLAYTVGGSATSPDDFTMLSGSLTIPAGQTSASLVILIQQDDLIEGTETISITLDSITSGDVLLSLEPSADSAEIDVLDDDTGEISIVSTSDGSESGEVAGVLTVTQSGIASVDAVVSYTVSGTASSGTDFVTPSGTVTITAGETSATIEIETIDDAVVESDETVLIELDEVVSGIALVSISTTAKSAGVQLIDDDTALVSVSATTNGNEQGLVAATVTVAQSAVSSTDTVIVLSLSGSASSADFSIPGNTITIPAGATTATLQIDVIDDDLVEGTENIVVLLDSISSGDSDVTIDAANSMGELFIDDNDLATIAFAAQSSDALETAGSHFVLVTLSVPGGGQIAQSVTIDVAVIGGTASTPQDFTLQNSSVTFPAGSVDGAVQTIQLNLVDDQIPDEVESVRMGLAIVELNANISLGEFSEHTVTITDDPIDATISGLVWIDADNDATSESGELTISNVLIRLTGTSTLTESISRETTTDVAGFFQFTDLPSGTYALTQTQPVGYLSGQGSVGTIDGTVTGVASNDQITNIVLRPSQDGRDYSFAELGLDASSVNRFRVLARPRLGQSLGQPITAESSVAAASLSANDASDTQASLSGQNQPQGELIVSDSDVHSSGGMDAQAIDFLLSRRELWDAQ